MAAYVVPLDLWYIIPARLVTGMRSISLCTPEGNYEEYREAWGLLKKGAGFDEESGSGPSEPVGAPDSAAGNGVATGPAVEFPSTAFERMEAAFNFARKRMGVEE